MDQIKRILKLCAPVKFRLIFGISLIFITITSTLIQPYLTRMLVDNVIGQHQLDQLKYILIFIIVLAAIRAVGMFVRSLVFESSSQRVTFNLRQQLYDHLHSLPTTFYDTHRIGEIMSRMTADMDAIRMLLANGFTMVFDNLFYFVGSLVFVAFMDWRLALTILVVAPFVAVIGRKYGRLIRPQHQAMREQNAVMNAKAQENISGIRVVKAYTREDYEIETFNAENRKHLNIGIGINRTVSNFNPLLDFIGAVPQALLIFVGGWMSFKGYITVGTVVAVAGYIWMIVMPMRMLGDIINMMAQTIASTGRLFYYIDLGSNLKEKANPYRPEKVAGSVTFQDVTFSYADTPVLKDISFDVKPGGTLAIMGATGSGKTSLINLIGRFYDCTKGSVLIDGVDVRDYSLNALRSHIGYVMQEPFLFSQSLGNNIAFGNLDATQDEIEAAAQASCTLEYVNEMSDGYDTVVGERGMGLSGGQKQRAAIARAICYAPDILILDDATSAVDMETEFAIQNGLKEVLANRTTFIVSHRISAVKDADEIIVLDNGVIAERGQHKELLAKKGLYYGIFMDQYKDFQDIGGEGLVNA